MNTVLNIINNILLVILCATFLASLVLMYSIYQSDNEILKIKNVGPQNKHEKEQLEENRQLHSLLSFITALMIFEFVIRYGIIKLITIVFG